MAKSTRKRNGGCHALTSNKIHPSLKIIGPSYRGVWHVYGRVPGSPNHQFWDAMILRVVTLTDYLNWDILSWCLIIEVLKTWSTYKFKAIDFVKIAPFMGRSESVLSAVMILGSLLGEKPPMTVIKLKALKTKPYQSPWGWRKWWYTPWN